MGRPKISRKSTWVDMTAFCDVAFLLLSFFIMATKTKPPEAVSVVSPTSVSSKAPNEKDMVTVIINQNGKVFLTMSEPDRKQQVVETVAKNKGVSLSASDLAKAKNMEFFGTPITQLSSFVNLPADKIKGDLLPGIPAVDSTNNEVTDWMRAVYEVYYGETMNLFVKGDVNSKYPAFKQVVDAFKKNEMMKFSIITNSIAVPKDSELAKEAKKENAK
ncbi:biopolymer transporter ExbD [Chitinophagaceae bacterium LY-5]|uniref:Biopolymer transporter ExbD n=2 Tax=Polluticaenibacter yanchengensis TaxID=3014562 RepID=A0ABT4UI20_9BACT|nr:biopolymer transporter ExbD [Chitinophagaceae bacterium LY-5]